MRRPPRATSPTTRGNGRYTLAARAGVRARRRRQPGVGGGRVLTSRGRCGARSTRWRRTSAPAAGSSGGTSTRACSKGTERFFRAGLHRQPRRLVDPGARRREGEARGGREGRRRRLRLRRVDDPDGQGVPEVDFPRLRLPPGIDRHRDQAREGGGRRRSRDLQRRQGDRLSRHRLRPGRALRLPARHGGSGRRRPARAHDARQGRHLADRRAVRRATRPEENHNPVGRVFYSASTMLCVPHSLAQEGPALGAQAGEARLREVVVDKGGFTRFRRATRDAVQPDPRGAPLSEAREPRPARLTARPAAGEASHEVEWQHARGKGRSAATAKEAGAAAERRRPGSRPRRSCSTRPSGCSSRSGTPRSPRASSARRPASTTASSTTTTVRWRSCSWPCSSASRSGSSSASARCTRPTPPFLVKWRKAMGFLEEDLAAGYPKIWLELQAMGWNRPRDAQAHRGGARRVAHGAHRGVRARDGTATGSRTDRLGRRGDGRARDDVQPGDASLERLSGRRAGATPRCCDAIDRWLASLEAKGARR